MQEGGAAGPYCQTSASAFATPRLCHASAGRRDQPRCHSSPAGSRQPENHGPLPSRRRRHRAFHQQSARNAGRARSGPGRGQHSTGTMTEHRLEVADARAAFHRNDDRASARSGRCVPHLRKRFLREMGTCTRSASKKSLRGYSRLPHGRPRGHVDECDECGHRAISYNSCRNRHCPKCQAMARAKWLAEREAELLPVPYFHVLFTVPQNIGGLALQNARQIYRILFRAASETLLTIAANPKHLGASIGFLAVLHTWGQNLHLHPHLHCVIPGGGISPDGASWVGCRKSFFLPVRVLSRL